MSKVANLILFILFILFIFLAYYAQNTLKYNTINAIGLYLIAIGISIIFILCRKNPSTIIDKHHSLSLFIKVTLFASIILIGLLVRVYNLANYPRGFDIDEHTGTEVIYFLSNTEDFSAGWQELGLGNPIYGIITTPFIKLLGLSIFSIRFISVFHSIITAIVVFLILNRVFKNYFISISSLIFILFSSIHISFSRLDGHVNFTAYTFLALYVLLLTFEEKRTKKLLLLYGLIFLFTFISLNIAYFFFVTPLILLAITIHRFITSKPKMQYFQHLLFTSLVFILCLPNLLYIFHFKSQNYHLTNWLLFDLSKFILTIKEILIRLFLNTSLFLNDIYFNRTSSLLHPYLLPLLVIGLVFLFFNLKKNGDFLVICLIIIPIIPALLSHVSLPRVYYISFVGFFIACAYTLEKLYQELCLFIKKPLLNYVFLLFISLFTVFIGIQEVHSYFTNLPIRANSEDSMIRKDFVDVIPTYIEDNSFIFYVYNPVYVSFFNQPITYLEEIFKFVQNVKKFGSTEKYYELISENDLTKSIFTNQLPEEKDFFHLAYQKSHVEKKGESLLNSCFRDIKYTETAFFKIYSLSRENLENSLCYSPQIILNNTQIHNNVATFSWSISTPSTKDEFITFLNLERKIKNTILIEAEEFSTEDITGWYKDTINVPKFSGNWYIVDNGQPYFTNNNKTYRNIDISVAGNYKIWIRYLFKEPHLDINTIYFNNQQIEFGKNIQQYDSWFWEDLGKYFLNKTAYEFSISKKHKTPNKNVQTYIDAIILTEDESFNPNIADYSIQNNEIFQSILSKQIPNNRKKIYTLSYPFEKGFYRWKLSVNNAENTIIDWKNISFGIDSEYNYFEISK